MFNLSNILADRGHQVTVATQRVAGVPDEEVLSSGVRVHRFATMAMRLPGVYSDDRQHHPPMPDPVGVRDLARIVRQERPEVIHAHNWSVNSVLPLHRSFATRHRFGLVLTLHDYSQVCATQRLMRAGTDARACCRALPSVRHYLLRPRRRRLVTAAATAAMRPWKNRAVDYTVSVSRAVADGNRIPNGPESSVIPNFILDSAVLGSAAGPADGEVGRFRPCPRKTSCSSSATFRLRKVFLHCCEPTNCSAKIAHH